MTCTEAPKVVQGLKEGRLVITEHQKLVCDLCQRDASAYNHCAFCGATFDTSEKLLEHLPGFTS